VGIDFSLFHSNQLSVETWKDIFKNVQENVSVYIDNEEINKKYKNDTSIVFKIDDLSDKVNASAIIINEFCYEIRIGRRLIQLLREYSWKVIDQHPAPFQHVKRDKDNQEELHNAADALLYFWIDYILFHEWSHIILGHCDHIASKNESLFEEFQYEENNADTNNDRDIERISMEYEADKFGSRFAIGRLSVIWEKWADSFYGKRDVSLVLVDYLLSFHYLFDLLENTANENKARKTHPDPMDRVFVFKTSLLEQIEGSDSFPTINEDTANVILSLASIAYWNESGKDNEWILESNNKAFENINGYVECLDEMELESFRLMKA